MKIYKNLKDGFIITEYEDRFAAAVADMWNESNEAWGGSLDTYTEDKVKIEVKNYAAVNVYLVIKEDEVVALAVLKYNVVHPKTFNVDLLNVRPDYHGSGFGKALILLCIERTAELGYDFLDLYTWPGNTKAMPLYKKCGFMWHENDESTFLINFMPHILRQPLFKNFFENNNWYENSSRKITQNFDNISKDDFDIFTYEFESEGKSLKLSYEQRGRKLCKIQTDDVLIELKAPKGKLAFGFDYDFEIVIKSKKNSNIKVEGQENDCIVTKIKESINLEGETILRGSFYIEELENLPNPELISPSVIVGMIVDGSPITLGLGIDIKIPIEVKFHKKLDFDTIGVPKTIYMDVKSNLLEEASVSFNFLKIRGAEFDKDSFSLELKENEEKQLTFTSTPKYFGDFEMEIDFEITQDKTDKTTNFSRKLYLVNRDLTSVFAFEDYGTQHIYAGPLHLTASPSNDTKIVNDLTGQIFYPLMPKLGMPFSEEVPKLEPLITIFIGEEGAIFRRRYNSKDFKDTIFIDIIKLSTSTIKRKLEVINISAFSPPKVIRSGFHLDNFGNRVVFKYDGKINDNKGTLFNALAEIEDEKFEENWIYVESPKGNFGIFWDESYKSEFLWGGEGIQLITDLSFVGISEDYETKESVIVVNTFNSWEALRNIATSSFSNNTPNVVPPQEFIVNDKNPVYDEIPENKIISRRLSEDELEIDEFNHLEGIFTAKISTENKEWTVQRYLVKTTGVTTTKKEGSAFVVENGKITFKLDPNYFDGIFSLTSSSGREYLSSKYPEHVAHSWFNPYFGGFSSPISGIKNLQFLKENITADFVTILDNFKNEWKGVKSTLQIKEHEKFKEITAENYFVTLPGTEIMAHFVKISNNSNSFKTIDLYPKMYVLYDEETTSKINFKDIYGEEYNLKTGGEDEFSVLSNGFISYKPEETNENLYALMDKTAEIIYTNEILVFETEKNIKLAHNESFISCPMFVAITKEHLTKEMFENFKEVSFEV